MSGRLRGFATLRPGKMHLRCPTCGRKQSNCSRDDERDPSNAVLLETDCPKCADIGSTSTYYDASGAVIVWETSDAPLAVSLASPSRAEDKRR